MIRPLFPNNIIPVSEIGEILSNCHDYLSCVVASGLGVNEHILKRLGLKENDFVYNESQEYLQGAINCEIKFVDVTKEMEHVKKECLNFNLALFEHSMPALNYLFEQEEHCKLEICC